jgi:hypothetical protein
MKRCPQCGKVLPLTAFVRDRSKRSGWASRCRACDRKRSRKYYDANRIAVVSRQNALHAKQRASKPPRLCKCGQPASSSRHHYCDRCRRARKEHREAERERTRPRPTTTQRGYGTNHQNLRKRWAQVIAEEPVYCARGTSCLYRDRPEGTLIMLGELWDLGHDDVDRSRYTGPEHRRCNRATTGRATARVSSEEW